MPKYSQNFKISLSLIQNQFGYPVNPMADKLCDIFPSSILLCIKQCAIMTPVSFSVLSISLFSLGSLAYISKELLFFLLSCEWNLTSLSKIGL